MGSSLTRAGAGLLAVVVVATSCGSAGASGGEALPGATTGAAVLTTPHEDRGPCRDRFNVIDLDHHTRGPGASQSMFDGTGAGVAVGDLDGDGWDDLVLANLSGHSTLLWNRKGLDFEPEALIEGRFRQPVVADIDGDGHEDIVLTTGVGRPLALMNTGHGATAAERFERTEIPGIDSYAYTIGWGDLGGDGDLDAVTGAYNAELTAQRRLNLGTQGGVSVFEATAAGSFEGHQLTRESQALAIRLGDIDGDGRSDILVGNDLATPDQIWLDGDRGWQRVAPFTETSYSTMSIDSADIDNDGSVELFSADMQQMDDRPETDAAYANVHADLAATPIVDDIQRPENVLSRPSGDGFENQARAMGVEATGWSWSGVFGDLDSDGFADLYVVNGMVADNLFAHLPDNELVEANQAFRNDGGRSFQPATSWGLGDEAGGRGMIMGDLDHDGDLDIVVNNLNAPARLFENQLCGGAALTIDLAWPGTANTRAWGSTVIVTSSDGTRHLRTVETTRGYLSGVTPTVHVGLGGATGPAAVEVHWPDGEISVDLDLAPDHHLVVTRSAEDRS